MRSWLGTLALPAGEQAELSAALRASSEFEVIDLLNKATVVTVAEVGGGVFSTLFSICSTFSILAGVLLIFLIFVMLAAERKSELGMARAVGMQRGHLIQMFVAEGLVYDLCRGRAGPGPGVHHLLRHDRLPQRAVPRDRPAIRQHGRRLPLLFPRHATIPDHCILPGRAPHLWRGRHRVLAR